MSVCYYICYVLDRYDQFANKSYILSSVSLIFIKLHNVHHASRSSICVYNNKFMYYVLEIIKFLSYII